MDKARIKAWRARIVQKVMQNKMYYGCAVLTMAVAAVFAGILHARIFPFAEGWYTYYAKCIHAGVLPYRDFEYLYPPVYIYAIALITRLFGYDLIVLRRLGVLVFMLIALGMYLAVCEAVGKKRCWIALAASLAAVFYLQSEVVQTFYDYVRLMDLFVTFSLFFLLKTVKGMIRQTSYRKNLILCGVFCALIINTKQNIGWIFSVYVIILMLYIGIWCRHDVKTVVRDMLYLVLPAAIVMTIIYFALWVSGSLAGFLSMTGINAAGAKGGMAAILFGWIPNNKQAFLAALPGALTIIVLLAVLYWWYRRTARAKATDTEANGQDAWIGLLFGGLMLAGLIVLAVSRGFAAWLLPKHYVSPYLLFLVISPVFLLCGIWGIADMIRRQRTMEHLILFFVMAGVYFAIAYGCGNSGGLAEGQSSIGVAFLIAAICRLLEKRYWRIARGVALTAVLVITLQCAAKKMVYTYNWWGMDEADYWSSTETTDVPLLRNIRMSSQTKTVVESIYREITANTTAQDPIFCFPQIPIFYCLCDRGDPGVFAKVQWFDVTADESLHEDIKVLQQNPPKAVLIYNTSEYAYHSHENAFRNGNASATREMREFLYHYVTENKYRFCGRYTANSNSLSLWIADDEAPSTASGFAGGIGTAEDPFLIADAAQLEYFSQMVNAGRSFDGQYIRQSCDIDMSGRDFVPIGETGKGAYFRGVYDGAGHVIRHITIDREEEDIGLFGGLAGAVYNLGMEDMRFNGLLCGAIACGSVDGAGKIINCYAAGSVTAYRAGGIVDYFNGLVENCFCYGTLQGIDSACAVSCEGVKTMRNIYSAADQLFTENGNVMPMDARETVCEDSAYLNSTALAETLNAYVSEWNQNPPDAAISLCAWQQGAMFLQFVQ